MSSGEISFEEMEVNEQGNGGTQTEWRSRDFPKNTASHFQKVYAMDPIDRLVVQRIGPSLALLVGRTL